MNDQDLKGQVNDLSKKVDMVYVSVEKTRKYFLALIIISIVAFVLPLVGLLFAVPTFLSTYNSALNF